MQIKRLFILTLFILTMAVFSSHGKDIYPDKLTEKYTRIALKNKDIFLKEKIELTSSEEKKEPVCLYLFGEEGGEDFYVAVTQARGRYELFDYLVAFSAEMKIKKIRVLKYRSEHGAEIAAKKWLEQFVGYCGGELRYKKDISAISGATISAKSITDDIVLLQKIVSTGLSALKDVSLN